MPAGNLSPYIDPTKCRTCGKCCMNYGVFYPRTSNLKEINDMILLSFRRDIDVKIYATPEDDERPGWWLIFNHPCKYLKEEETEEGMTYECKIYFEKDRPASCSLFPFEETVMHDCPHKEMPEEG